MSLEEGTSFWSSSLMWKVFFCAAIAFPTYNAGKNVLSTNNTSKLFCTTQMYLIKKDLMYLYFSIDPSESVHSKGIYFFGKFNENTIYFSYSEFPIFIIFGLFGGVLGALFVNINYRLSIFRMKLVVVLSFNIFSFSY